MSKKPNNAEKVINENENKQGEFEKNLTIRTPTKGRRSSSIKGAAGAMDERQDSEFDQPLPGCFQKVSKITNDKIDENLAKIPYFHGFLLHEYQPMILKTFGDFLIRVSIRYPKKAGKTSREKTVNSNKGKKSKEKSKEQSNDGSIRFNVIIGVCIKDQDKDKVDHLDETKHEIIDVPMTIEQNIDGKWIHFYIDKKKKFGSIEELTDYYRHYTGFYRDKKFSLYKGIPMTSWELDRTHVEIGTKTLGEGAFGEVKSGTWKCTNSDSRETNTPLPVAIKMLKGEESKVAMKEMMHEARLQLCLRHKNVLKTYGVCILKTPFMIISEFCENGALREYLKKNKVDIEDKLRFCLGSARGVDYLHGKCLIHRDLAARNVLLNDAKVPKIADFGLARYGNSYKMSSVQKTPIRYLAPETLQSYKFTQKTDVYTFGLVMWEIFENGQEPYVKPQQHMESIVPKNGTIRVGHLKEVMKNDLWIKFNSETPPTLQTFVAEKVFVYDEKKRVTMIEVVALLKTLVRKDQSYLKDTMATQTVG
ncbi:unnamed protein product [Caenorhabditis angaria]|uniref:non-specific protein-tyrosine kinase n=1 Tax=Caenorhabditis angaria TaxID=860376 RepID=A0A9P1I9A0_9PELO|nr:unnamed protein product [Caenorhabditis angaria]